MKIVLSVKPKDIAAMAMALEGVAASLRNFDKPEINERIFFSIDTDVDAASLQLEYWRSDSYVPTLDEDELDAAALAALAKEQP